MDTNLILVGSWHHASSNHVDKSFPERYLAMVKPFSYKLVIPRTMIDSSKRFLWRLSSTHNVNHFDTCPKGQRTEVVHHYLSRNGNHLKPENPWHFLCEKSASERLSPRSLERLSRCRNRLVRMTKPAVPLPTPIFVYRMGKVFGCCLKGWDATTNTSIYTSLCEKCELGKVNANSVVGSY